MKPSRSYKDTLNEFNDKFKNMIDSSRKFLDSINYKQKASKAEQKEQ